MKGCRRVAVCLLLVLTLFHASISPVLASNIGSEEFLKTYDPEKTYEIKPILLPPSESNASKSQTHERNPNVSIVGSPYANIPDSELSTEELAAKYGTTVGELATKSVSEKVGGFFSTLWSSVTKTVKSATAAATKTVSHVAQTVSSFISKTVSSIGKAASNRYKSVSTWLSNVVKSASSFVSSTARSVSTGVGDILSSVSNWFYDGTKGRIDSKRKSDESKKQNESEIEWELEAQVAENYFGNIKYQVGPPKRPAFKQDNGFTEDHVLRKPNLSDKIHYFFWRNAAELGQYLRPIIFYNATPAYLHFIRNEGRDRKIDYESFVKDDLSGQKILFNSIRDAKRNAVELCKDKVDCSVTSQVYSLDNVKMIDNKPYIDSRFLYPENMDWQYAMGGHNFWVSADVHHDPKKPNEYSMKVTIHAEDKYNFNPKNQAIRTGIKDEENGRFEVSGLGKQYINYGIVEREVRWSTDQK